MADWGCRFGCCNRNKARLISKKAEQQALLLTLHQLYMFHCTFEDLPSEVCGSGYPQDVLDTALTTRTLRPDNGSTRRLRFPQRS
jgi:hypothetical protein